MQPRTAGPGVTQRRTERLGGQKKAQGLARMVRRETVRQVRYSPTDIQIRTDLFYQVDRYFYQAGIRIAITQSGFRI